MNKIIEREKIVIKDMIYQVRGAQVMLDSDIAKLYQVETKRVNEAAQNNHDKFPERFRFGISEKEYNALKSKISTTKISNMSRSNPRIIMDQGLYKLATILKLKVATEVSIADKEYLQKILKTINLQ